MCGRRGGDGTRCQTSSSQGDDDDTDEHDEGNWRPLPTSTQDSSGSASSFIIGTSSVADSSELLVPPPEGSAVVPGPSRVSADSWPMLDAAAADGESRGAVSSPVAEPLSPDELSALPGPSGVVTFGQSMFQVSSSDLASSSHSLVLVAPDSYLVSSSTGHIEAPLSCCPESAPATPGMSALIDSTVDDMDAGGGIVYQADEREEHTDDFGGSSLTSTECESVQYAAATSSSAYYHRSSSLQDTVGECSSSASTSAATGATASSGANLVEVALAEEPDFMDESTSSSGPSASTEFSGAAQRDLEAVASTVNDAAASGSGGAESFPQRLQPVLQHQVLENGQLSDEHQQHQLESVIIDAHQDSYMVEVDEGGQPMVYDYMGGLLVDGSGPQHQQHPTAARLMEDPITGRLYLDGQLLTTITEAEGGLIAAAASTSSDCDTATVFRLEQPGATGVPSIVYLQTDGRMPVESDEPAVVDGEDVCPPAMPLDMRQPRHLSLQDSGVPVPTPTPPSTSRSLDVRQAHHAATGSLVYVTESDPALDSIGDPDPYKMEPDRVPCGNSDGSSVLVNEAVMHLHGSRLDHGQSSSCGSMPLSDVTASIPTTVAAVGADGTLEATHSWSVMCGDGAFSTLTSLERHRCRQLPAGSPLLSAMEDDPPDDPEKLVDDPRPLAVTGGDEDSRDISDGWLCRYCCLRFESASMLNLHIQAHSSGRETAGGGDDDLVLGLATGGRALRSSDGGEDCRGQEDVTPFCCPQCDREFDCRDSLVAHASSHGRLSPVPLPPLSAACQVNGGGAPFNGSYRRRRCSYRCIDCGESFSLHQWLEKHRRLMHAAALPPCRPAAATTPAAVAAPAPTSYSCPEPERTAASEEDTCEFPRPCRICGRVLHSRRAAETHLTSHRRRLQCPICQQLYHRVLSLHQHVKSHLVNGVYTCPVCHKTFALYSRIRKHIRSLHGESIHKCSVCGKVCPSADKLRMHMLIHSNHREFLCSECGKQFKRKDKLKDHVRRLHSADRKLRHDVPDEVINLDVSEKVPATDYHRFMYKCHWCKLGFKRRGMLINHLANRHAGWTPEDVPELMLPILKTTKNFCCLHCDKVYKSSSKRKSHILKCHPGASLPATPRSINWDEKGAESVTLSYPVSSVSVAPHPCLWCHRQYASRAKLLQHHRRQHADMLPPADRRPRSVRVEYADSAAQWPPAELEVCAVITGALPAPPPLQPRPDVNGTLPRLQSSTSRRAAAKEGITSVQERSGAPVYTRHPSPVPIVSISVSIRPPDVASSDPDEVAS